MALKLCAQDFANFDFEGGVCHDWQIGPGPGKSIVVAAFWADDRRDSALKKAWAYVDAQGKPGAASP
jgi:hypothetical protein